MTTTLLNFSLVSWTSGIVLIGLFVLVVIGLVAAVFMLMNSAINQRNNKKYEFSFHMCKI